MAGAGAAGAGHQEYVIGELSKAVLEVVGSSHFDRENIVQRELKLSQAYCLLWQDQESGEVKDRMVSPERNSGCVATVLLDLAALGMIEIEVEPKKLLGVNYTNKNVKVVNDSMTGTYLDEALFDEMRKRHEKKVNDPKEVKDWIRDDVHKFTLSKRCAAVTLQSLVDRGILDEKKKFIGKKFPTLNAGPETALVDEIRKIALEGVEPDSYMRALLTIMRAVDDLYCLKDPLLKKHFTSEEYKGAKERIKALVGLGKKGPESYKEM